METSEKWLVMDSLRNDVPLRTRRGDLLSLLTFNETQVARWDVASDVAGVENFLGERKSKSRGPSAGTAENPRCSSVGDLNSYFMMLR